MWRRSSRCAAAAYTALDPVVRGRCQKTRVGVGVRRRELLGQCATPAYRRAYVGQQFVEMLEVKGRDAQSAVNARGRSLDPLEVQHHVDIFVHLGGGRLLRQLAVAVAHQPIRGHLGA